MRTIHMSNLSSDAILQADKKETPKQDLRMEIHRMAGPNPAGRDSQKHPDNAG